LFQSTKANRKFPVSLFEAGIKMMPKPERQNTVRKPKPNLTDTFIAKLLHKTEANGNQHNILVGHHGQEGKDKQLNAGCSTDTAALLPRGGKMRVHGPQRGFQKSVLIPDALKDRAGIDTMFPEHDTMCILTFKEDRLGVWAGSGRERESTESH
jgi:hypothetical protein